MIAISIMLIMLMTSGSAEPSTEDQMLDEIGLDNLENLARESGIQPRKLISELMSGKTDFSRISISECVNALGTELKHKILPLIIQLCAPVFVGMALRILLGGGAGATAGVALLCRFACVRIMMESFATTRQMAAEVLKNACSAVGAITPVLASAMTLTGCTATAAALSPAASLCASAIENVLVGVGLPLCDVSAAVAAAGNLSESFRLDRLSSLLINSIKWVIGIMMTAFIGILSVEGLLSATQDSTAMRSMRYIVENMLPIVGGEVSGATTALAGSAVLARSAVGVTGILLLFGACARPMAKLAASYFSMRLAAAVFEPVSERSVSAMISRFADVSEILLAISASAVVLGILTIGTALAVLGGIGHLGG